MASYQVAQDFLPSPALDSIPLSVSMCLRQDQLLRHLGDRILEELVQLVEISTVRKGQKLEDIKQYGLCIVRSGAVDARMSMAKLTAGARTRISPIFRTFEDGDSLLPTYTVLASMVRWRSSLGDSIARDERDEGPETEVDSIDFVCSRDCELLVVTTSKWNDFLTKQKSAVPSITQAIFRRLFFSTIPVARRYFGLDETLFGFMSSITSHLRRPFEEWSLSLDMITTWLEAIRRLEGSVAQNASQRGFTVQLDSPAVATFRRAEHNMAGWSMTRGDIPSFRRRVFPSGTGLSRNRGSFDSQPPLSLDSPLSTFESRSFSLRRPSRNSLLSFSPLSSRSTEPDDIPNMIREQSGRLLLLALGFSREDMRGLFYSPPPDDIGLHDAQSPFALGWGRKELEQQNFLRRCIDEIQVVFFTEGSVLVQEGERFAGIYYVLSGGFEISVPGKPERTEEAQLGDATSDGYSRPVHGVVEQGDIVGYHSILEHNTSAYDIVARHDSYICVLPREMVRSITNKFPIVLHTMAQRVVEALPTNLRLVDFSINWTPYLTGEKISQKRSSLSVVLKGRCRLKISKDRNDYDELQQGDCLGIQQLFRDYEPSLAAYAVRPSEIAHIQFGAYEALSLLEPHVALSLAKIGSMTRERKESSRNAEQGSYYDSTPSRPDFHTVAVFPLTPDVPVHEVAARLMESIIDTGIKSERKVAVLDSQQIMAHFGVSDMHDVPIVEVGLYLAHLEDVVDLLIFVGDADAHSIWTHQCILHADSILLVADTATSPDLTDMDDVILMMSPKCRMDLVLLHDRKKRISPSGITNAWLEIRTWINGGHHHVLFNRHKPNGVDHSADKTPPAPLQRSDADFHRLARLLFGKAIALVLSGGGARGMAHLGFIRALEEAGIPIDIIGGTSMGACVGGVYAQELEWQATQASVAKISARFNVWSFMPDVTYPHVSATTGARLQGSVRGVYGDARIEDMWVHYYCAVTNLSRNGAQTQSYGDATRSVVASMSYPGLVPPTCMDGELLLDGCFSSNLPVARARQLGAGTVFVVDVSPIDPLGKYDYGEVISGWTVLKNMLKPAGKLDEPLPPSVNDIFARLTLSPSIAEVEAIKRSPNCHYIALPVGHYSARAFDKVDELVAASYEFSTQWFKRNIVTERRNGE